MSLRTCFRRSWPALGLLSMAVIIAGCGQNFTIRTRAVPKKDVLITSDPVVAEAAVTPPAQPLQDGLLTPAIRSAKEAESVLSDTELPYDDLAWRPPLRAPGVDAPPDWVPGDYRPLGFEGITIAELEKPLDAPPEAKDLRRVPDPEIKDTFCDVWFDKANKRIVMAGRIVRRTGPMELFACLHRSKEHESIVSIRTKAYAVHALLMAMGCMPGRAVQFQPEYKPAEGPEVEVTVHWTDDAGVRRSARAQEWLLNERTGRELEHPWVFGGSGFWKDEDGTPHYLAESGDFICVSNFNSATLDLPIESSQANNALMFSAYTKRIPPVGTPVAVILSPKVRRSPLGAPPPGKSKVGASRREDRSPLSAPKPPRGQVALFSRALPRAGAVPLFAPPRSSDPEVFEPLAAVPARPSLAAPPLRQFTVVTKKSADHVKAIYGTDGITFSVRSSDGIGRAEIALRHGQWPKNVSIHLNCSMLESFHVDNGQLHLSGSLAEGALPPISYVGGHGTLVIDGKPVDAQSPLFLPIRRLGASLIEVQLPRTLVEKQPAKIVISWIDAFRG